MDYAAIGKAAGAVAPMGAAAPAPILHGRTIYLDGDGLAYYCAGNDETTVAEARERTRNKVAEATRAAQAEKAVILLTGSGGHKGHRYAIARVKPYQGQRTNSKRPKNWAALRQLLEAGEFGERIIYYDREADDGFGFYGWSNPKNTVIYTQDKDMQMVPGYHLDWKDHRMFYLAPDQFDATFNEKQYGMKWFWLQMLHGDNADHIPGLPWVVLKANGKPERCGEVTARKILSTAATSEEAGDRVRLAYQSYYKERWLVEMMEQACLLWMRQGAEANWFEACGVKGPLAQFCDKPFDDLHYAGWEELKARVEQAQQINDLSPQDD